MLSARMLTLALALALSVTRAHLQLPPSVSKVQHRFITADRREPLTTLEASPRAVDGRSPGLATASWGGLDSTHDAWVGLYLEGEDPRVVVPLKYKFCNASRNATAGTSGGSLTFRLLNFRQNLVFRLMLGWKRPLLIAESNPIVVSQTGVPTGVRLALTSEPEEMLATWTSTELPSGGVALLRYTIIAGDGLGTSHESPATGTSYARGDLCAAPASEEGFRNPGVFYTASMTGLLPGLSVKYSVGSSAGGWSQEFEFRTQPRPGAPVRILAIGDMGQNPDDESAQADFLPWYKQEFAWGDPGATNTTRAMLRDHQQAPADFILDNGDISYAMGYSSLWEVFHDHVQPLSAAVPWMITMGNHERDWPNSGSTAGRRDSFGECGVPTLRRFPMPYLTKAMPPHDEPWYELRTGCVLLLAISTEHDVSPGSRQHNFISEALSRVDRLVTPWVVLAGHRFYHISSSFESDEEWGREYRQAIGDLIEGQVDVVFGAHHHSYQRTCRARGTTCVEDGMLTVNIGNGGAENSPANATKAAFFEYVDDKHFGYVRITATAEPAELTIEYVRSDDEQVHDRVLLRKTAPSPLAAAGSSELHV